MDSADPDRWAFYGSDPELVDFAEVAAAPIIRSERLSGLDRWHLLELPLPVVHPAHEARVAAAMDISLNQLGRILGQDLAVDIELVTWELDEAPAEATTGLAAVVRTLDGRAPLTQAVPIPPDAERPAELTLQATELMGRCAALREHIAAPNAGEIDSAHQALYESFWSLVEGERSRRERGP